jgi:hypothetical protein
MNVLKNSKTLLQDNTDKLMGNYIAVEFYRIFDELI